MSKDMNFLIAILVLGCAFGLMYAVMSIPWIKKRIPKRPPNCKP